MAKTGVILIRGAAVILLLVFAGCATETWGRVRTFPPKRERLLTEIEQRRGAGIRESRTIIAELFPDRRQLAAENPEAARAAERGELSVASAAWWGWNNRDSTEILSRAFSAPVDLLIVPAGKGPWITGPLLLDGPRHLLFEPGAELLAKEGDFRKRRDSLLTLYRADDVTLTGYGARVAMRKNDYTKEPYQWSQHRHALAVLESQNISVQGFLIESSGGDGVYIGQDRDGLVPRNILLKDLFLQGNYRQGVSVISVDGFRMEYSHVSRNGGTPPGSAIDFEPNSGLYGLTNCIVLSCLFEKNLGSALTVHLPNVLDSHPPVSILIQDTHILGNPLALWVHGLWNGAQGSLEFRNTRVKGIGLMGRSESFSIIR